MRTAHRVAASGTPGRRTSGARSPKKGNGGNGTAFAQPIGAVFDELRSERGGLSTQEAALRYAELGPNVLPEPRPPSVAAVVGRQFLSPFIYVLLGAAALSVASAEWSDAGFIGAVVVLNAIIGAVQESKAESSARALRQMVTTTARVARDGELVELGAEALVPGDLVVLASGDKVPADVRLVDAQDLHTDESLLTGESLPVGKHPERTLPPGTSLADRQNMAYAGTFVTRGRAEAVVVSTGARTEIGTLASQLSARRETEPPLLTRMRRFTRWVASVVLVVAIGFAVIEAARGTPWREVALVAIALAVSAIPEGLPVAMTVALAVAVRRMARRHVIVRRMAAVEALGSCTTIASDKTGTLTVNELTAAAVVLPGGSRWDVTGAGTTPQGEAIPRHPGDESRRPELADLARSAALCNDAVLAKEDGTWSHRGDAVDISLLVLARKLGLSQSAARAATPFVARIPFESERRFMATLHEPDQARPGAAHLIDVKGAVETVLPMCSYQKGPTGDQPLVAEHLTAEAESLAHEGFRVIAVASGPLRGARDEHSRFRETDLHDLVLLGLVGMFDPPRPSAPAAVAACRSAGLRLLMLTGDHPATALAVARRVGLASGPEDVADPAALRRAASEPPDADGRRHQLDELVEHSTVFARIEPSEKLAIVESIIRSGELVAVTGDGANDAPALRQANVGVAMGRSGTDVAREAGELIVTDDDLSSLVAGIEEGRIAYGNIRRVIGLLVSTGAAEIVLFLLALATGMAPPLTAVQLLWLNLVTNGIQDVFLALEHGDGDEMRRPPRPPREPVFDRLMTERVVVSGGFIGLTAFATAQILVTAGWDTASVRNAVMALLVLFENAMVFNARSETRSFLRTGLKGNPLLVLGTLLALALHITAMHLPFSQQLLQAAPLPAHVWLAEAAAALGLFVVIEIDKAVCRRRDSVRRAPLPAANSG